MSYQEENELLRSAVSCVPLLSCPLRVVTHWSQMADLVEKHQQPGQGGPSAEAEDDDPETRFPTSLSQQHPSDYISDDDERED
jgi:hypothetical protein